MRAAREIEDIVSVIESAGVTLTKKGKEWKGLCPFHEEDTPSFSVNREKGVFFCFGCGAKGNARVFQQMKAGKIVRGSSLIEKVMLPASMTAKAAASASAAHPVGDRGEVIERVVASYHEALSRNKTALEYLKSRGIGDMETLRRFRIGYSTGTLKDKASAKSEAGAALRFFGYVNERGYEHFTGCVVWPIHDAAGAAVGMYGRRVIGKQGAPKHLYLPGPHRGVFNRTGAKAAAASGKPVIVCECVIDAHSCIVAGLSSAIALYGTNGLTGDHIELLRELAPQKVILMLDADKAGSDATVKIAERLAPLGIPLFKVTLPEGKDANDVLVESGAEALREAVAAAAPIARPNSTALATENGGALTETSSGQLEYHVDGRAYHIKNFVVSGFARMRATVILANVDGVAHIDTMDLYSNRARTSFVTAASERLGISADAIDADLLGMILALDRYRSDAVEKLQGHERPIVHVMTPEEKRGGMEFLTSDDLIDQVTADCATVGYVGEANNKALAYLIATSRKMREPLSAILVAGSAAGKSALLDVIEYMMPPEDLYAVSDLTDNALYYMQRDELTHKLLIVAERSGSEDADYCIRELQTKRVLRKSVAVKDRDTERIKTIRIEVRGPVAVMESTTNPRMNPENANRCFVLHVDESRAQTEAIQQAQRRSKTVKALEGADAREKIIQKHQAAQRLLEPVCVVIPFAEKITFPIETVRTRRDHARFLNLIEVVAFLNQKKRAAKESSGRIFIEATLDDYDLARRLALEVLTSNLDELPRAARELLDVILGLIESRAKGKKREDVAFTRAELVDASGWTYGSIRSALNALMETECVLCERAARGRVFYRLGTVAGRPDVVLPETAELRAKMDTKK